MRNIQTKWSIGDEINDKSEIGQLVIDGNGITFHIDGYGDFFSSNFVGKDDLHYYKVYTSGQEYADSSGFFYHVTKAFQYNGNDYKDFVGKKITGITSFSFEIPELADWLNLRSVEFHGDDDNNMVIREKQIKPILIRKSNPKIYLGYELNLPFHKGNEKIEMTLRNAPRVFVEYETEVDDTIVIGHLSIIMRFLGLLIGRISYADDIRLTLKGYGIRMWLFVNRDFSYNSSSSSYRSRFNFDIISDSLEYYFEKWVSFSEDEKFSYLQDVFFHYNGKREAVVEDLFLTYCKFLEGYDLRVSQDEEKANGLKDKLDQLMRLEEVKSVLSPLFKEAGSSYKPKEIAKWISTGFLERVSLKDRIKRLDLMYLKIISANSGKVIRLDDDNEFYSLITKTRNFYSHFKQDNSGILSFAEIYRTIPLLEVLIVIILLNEIGISIEVIKNSMIRDEQYWSLLSHHRPQN